MKVFIGWSGARSQALAQALHDWIPLVLHYVAPWLSETDVAAGERWGEAIAKELEASNFGIICITRENLASPWILFEAGSLAKSLKGSLVIPLLLDLEFSEISGPLAQFQAKKVDQEGLSEVIQSVNRAAAQPVPEARAKQLFEALWPEFEKRKDLIPAQVEQARPIRSQHQILEELVAGVRSLETRLREVAEVVSTQGERFGRFRRFGRMHPMMLHELAHTLGEKPDDPNFPILVFSSLVREELPWLYELGMEAYRAAKAGDHEEAKNALRRFRRAAEFMTHGPFPEEFGMDPRALHMMLRDLDHMLPEGLAAEEEPRTKPKRRKEPRSE
jgi:hypothetical protein